MPVNDTIEQFLTDTHRTLTNAREPAVQEHIAAYGFGPDHLEEGLDLLEEARAAYDTYLDEHYEMGDAVRQHRQGLARLRAQFVRHRKLLRVVFEGEPTTIKRLRLSVGIPDAQGKLLNTAEKMYRTLLADDDLQARAAEVTVTSDAVRSALADIEAVRSLSIQRDRETSEAQASTGVRDDAIADLRGWMHDFRRITDVALEPNPQLKEMLGRTVPSR